MEFKPQQSAIWWDIDANTVYISDITGYEPNNMMFA